MLPYTWLFFYILVHPINEVSKTVMNVTFWACLNSLALVRLPLSYKGS